MDQFWKMWKRRSWVNKDETWNERNAVEIFLFDVDVDVEIFVVVLNEVVVGNFKQLIWRKFVDEGGRVFQLERQKLGGQLQS